MDVSPTIQHLHGQIFYITGTNPLPGDEVSEIVPSRRRWRLLSFLVSLVTDANAADRFVHLYLSDGTDNFHSIGPFAAHTASTTLIYSYGIAGQQLAPVSGVACFRLPDIMLAPGYEILTLTTNIQAADNFGPPHYLVEEWIDP